jgi:hypothetical protein
MIVTIIVVPLRGIRLFDFHRDYHPFLFWGPLRHPTHMAILIRLNTTKCHATSFHHY